MHGKINQKLSGKLTSHRLTELNNFFPDTGFDMNLLKIGPTKVVDFVEFREYEDFPKELLANKWARVKDSSEMKFYHTIFVQTDKGLVEVPKDSAIENVVDVNDINFITVHSCFFKIMEDDTLYEETICTLYCKTR